MDTGIIDNQMRSMEERIKKLEEKTGRHEQCFAALNDFLNIKLFAGVTVKPKDPTQSDLMKLNAQALRSTLEEWSNKFSSSPEELKTLREHTAAMTRLADAAIKSTAKEKEQPNG